MIKKDLALATILLFIGLAFAPSIHANLPKDKELVEITTEICGIQGITPNTVKLTKQESIEVEKLIDDIKSRLDKAETREETVEIFNEAVVELDKYGLLGGLSIEETQKLITIRHQINNKKIGRAVVEDIEISPWNALCFIAVHSKGERTVNLRFLLNWLNFLILGFVSNQTEHEIIENLFISLFYKSVTYCQLKPIRFFDHILIANFGKSLSYFTIGLGGIHKGTSGLRSIWGFVGVKIILSVNKIQPGLILSDESFYLGWAYIVVP